MSDSLFNPHWYRIARVKLRLKRHIRTHRHIYRGRVWYILHDESSGKHHRYNEATYRFIRLIDGTQTVEEIWEHLCEVSGDEAPTQNEVMSLLGSLYFADCILGDIPVDVEELIDRRNRQRKKLLNAKLANPVSIKIPLFDPDQLLSRTMKIARPFFTRFAVLLMSLLVLAAAFSAWRHWGTISSHAAENALQPSNLLMIILLYPFIKGLHELGHAYAVKHWGGDVHEIGVMLLVFMPVPYVDASAASAFRNKSRRMIVAAAGIIVELLLAAIALLLWLNIQQGLISDILFNIMLIGGISTLLFNGNPLLRFDGYYVLADAIEIPGLGARSNKYISYLIQKHLFGVRDAHSPETSEGEDRWFTFYAIASFIYRMLIMVSIVLYVANEYFFIGTAIAIWIIIKQLLMPVYKMGVFVTSNPSLSRNRRRAILTTSGLLLVTTAGLFSIPAPLNTLAEGVIWMPEHSYVRAGNDGFIIDVATPDGTTVNSGQQLITTEDITLEHERDLLRARLTEAKSQHDAIVQDDRVEAEIIKEDIKLIMGELERMEERIGDSIVTSPDAGLFVLPSSRRLEGQYVKQGDTLGYVIDRHELSVRAVVPQEDIGLVRKSTDSVEIRFESLPGKTMPSSVIREIPAATYLLPSRALSVTGGGNIQTDPFDQDGLRTHEKYFQFDLSMPTEDVSSFVGQRVYVKFRHGYEPLAIQWYRDISELFLDELGKV